MAAFSASDTGDLIILTGLQYHHDIFLHLIPCNFALLTSVDTVTKLQIVYQRSKSNPSMKFYSYNCANTGKACIITTLFYE